MNLKAWLEAERGRHKALAAHLGVSPGRVTQMAQAGVPAKHMLAIRDFTHGEVTLEEMAVERAAQALEPAFRRPGGAYSRAGTT